MLDKGRLKIETSLCKLLQDQLQLSIDQINATWSEDTLNKVVGMLYDYAILEQTNEELKRAEVRISDFASLVSHLVCPTLDENDIDMSELDKVRVLRRCGTQLHAQPAPQYLAFVAAVLFRAPSSH